jgi:hypothetical protein
MNDDPFTAPGHIMPPRVPRPGELSSHIHVAVTVWHHLVVRVR